MLNRYGWQLYHWHIEPSSKCSLKCPRCPRQEHPDISWMQKEISLDEFKRVFSHEVLRQTQRFTMCGDVGDPIYAKDYIAIIEYIKSYNPEIQIFTITNGSYKKPEWWKKLISVLNEYDEIHFSLDGWDQESNSKYRVNCDWSSIIEGIKCVVGHKAVITWAGIVFGFNEHNINMMKGMAIGLGMDKFQLTASTKFGCNYEHYNIQGKDYLEPSLDHVARQGRFERNISFLTDKRVKEHEAKKINLEHFHKIKPKNNIVPLCMIGTKGLYINSQGYFMPCCWLGNRYQYDTYSQFLVDELNVKKHGIEKVLNNNYWETFFDNFHRINECKSKCSAKVVNKEYATNW